MKNIKHHHGIKNNIKKVHEWQRVPASDPGRTQRALVRIVGLLTSQSVPEMREKWDSVACLQPEGPDGR